MKLFYLALCAMFALTFGRIANLEMTKSDQDENVDRFEITSKEDRIENKHQEKGAAEKRIAPGVVIAAAELTLTLLKSVLNEIANVNRKVAIGIANETPYDWQAIGLYFESGTSDDVLPPDVLPEEAAIYGARKTAGPVATGAVGVLCYYVPQMYKSVCVMFSVPFDYNWYSNWWNVKIYQGRANVGASIYEDMYNDDPFKGDDKYHSKYLGHGLNLKRGCMSSSGTAALQIVIH